MGGTLKKSIVIFITLTCLYARSNTVENFELVSDGDRIQLEFKLDEISLESIGDYSKIKSKSNSEISTVGMPKIPSYTSMLMLDPTKEYSVSYEVESSYVIDNVYIILYMICFSTFCKFGLKPFLLAVFFLARAFPPDIYMLHDIILILN